MVIIINPILIRVYPCKWGWLDLPHTNSNLSNSHSSSCSIHGILLLQTNILVLLLYLRLLWSSLLPLDQHKLNPLQAKWPMEPVLISGFCSVKWMRVLIIPPGWDTNLSQKEPGPCGQKAEILPTAPIKPALMVNIILSFFTAIYMQLKIKFKGDA